MGRPALPIGSWGDIRTRRMSAEGVEPERWTAIAQFRDMDGRTRQVERHGESKTKAENTLRKALTKRAGAAVLSGDSTFADAARIWLEEIRGDLAGTTHDTHRRRLDRVLIPRFGDVRLRECTTGRIARFLRTLDGEYSAGSRRGFRQIMSLVFTMAVEYDILPTNPTRGIRIKGASKPAVAYDIETLGAFLAKLDADSWAANADMPDLLRFLFGTGVRYGEALGLRWRDVNLTDETVTVDGQKIPPCSVWINGNIVHVAGEGVTRNQGKTFRANRVVGMPGFLHTILTLRRPVDAHPYEPVFPSPFGGWRRPNNVQRSVRRLRERIGYPKFTTHIARKTVATILDDAGQSARQVADQLGHAAVSTTQNTYFGRGMANPDAAAALDAAHRPAVTD